MVPACDPTTLDPRPLLDFSSGYVLRATADLPKQGSRKPWFIRQNDIRDAITMKLARIDDGVLHCRPRNYKVVETAFLSTIHVPLATSASAIPVA